MTTDILGTHGGCWSEGITESGSENRLDGGQRARREELLEKVGQEDSALPADNTRRLMMITRTNLHRKITAFELVVSVCRRTFVYDTHPVV